MVVLSGDQSAVNLPQSGDWWLIQSKPQQEFRLASDLSARGVSFFLPTIRRHGRIGHQKITRDFPLFPSYLFLRGQPGDTTSARCTNRVVNILPVHNQPQLTEELMAIAAAIASGAALHRKPLQAGQAVRITDGPMMGIVGIVVGAGPHESVMLTCSMLGTAVQVDVGRDMIEVLTEN